MRLRLLTRGLGYILLLLFFQFMSQSASAQNLRKITGIVTDSIGKGIPNVTVTEQGTTRATATSTDGSFVIGVSGPEAVLSFTSVGFTAAQVTVGNQTDLSVRLQNLNTALSEVVVIGYGTQRRADVTSAVATVKSENFVKAPVQDAGQLLQGKVAGLSVSNISGNPTGGSQIMLRGNNTIYGATTDPLVIIDGVPGSLKTVAPEDIESIDVLKDGSAAAIYGVRGTNGVILITTKRAKGNYTSSVEYSGSVSTQKIVRKLDVLTADDYRAQIAAGKRAATDNKGASTDWLDEIMQTPLTHVHNLTFRGGNSRTNYLANLNYRYLEGFFLKSDNKTFTGRVDVNHSMLDDKLRLNFQLLNSNNNFTQTQDGGTFNGYTYRQALIRNPTEPVYDSLGRWNENPGNFNYENPLARLYESDGETKSINSRMNASLTYTPVKGLKLFSLFSYNRNNLNAGYAETKQHISTRRDNRNGYAAVGSSLAIDRLAQLSAEYSKVLGDHRFTILGGYEYQEREESSNFIQNWDFLIDNFGYNDVEAGNAIKEGKGGIGSSRGITNLISFYSRLTYNFRDKYLLTANLRHEGASQLWGSNEPWGTFPAVSLGWRITKEGFMQGQQLFDDLKLRVGYGVTGNPPISNFLSQATLRYGSAVYVNGEWIQSLVPNTNPNPFIRWEEKSETNFGLDFSMLKGRVFGDVNYYVRTNKDLLYEFQVPSPPNIFDRTLANAGKMENRGIEVLLNVVPVRTRDFEWTTSINFSANKNKLINLNTELYQQTNDYFTWGGTGEPIQTFTHLNRIGRSIGDFYGFKVIDIDQNGKWIYEGSDGKAVPYDQLKHGFADKQVLGNGLPKYYAGWNNNVRYKNFDLGVTMRGAFDYQVLNMPRMYLENPTIINYNRLRSSQDMVFGKALLNAPLEFNNYYIEDGDFWKIDNITLGYNFNQINSKYVKSARVFVSTLNTFVFTGYSGVDPEVNRAGLDPGVDNRDAYPSARTFTLGVNLSL